MTPSQVPTTLIALAALLAVSLVAVLLRYRALARKYAPVLDAEVEARRLVAEARRANAQMLEATERTRAVRLRDIEEAEASAQRALSELARQQAELAPEVERLSTELAALSEEANLQEFGFYAPRYSFADSPRYQAELEKIRGEQKSMLKAKTAAVGTIEWTVNGSKAEGRKQIAQTLKLMLRAFNGECDAAVVKVRYNNVHVMEARIRKAYETVNSLAQVQSCVISKEYLQLKLQELWLAHEYEEKLQAEKDEQRRIREQMREEELAQRELERARQEAEKEESRYQSALEKARNEVERAAGAKQEQLRHQIADLEARLAEAQVRKERAISQAQLTRSGHVYIISNIGSFGEHVYKIGMTRRLEPLDRIRELGDASVPFQFDVHAIVYTEDAPTLENKLHRVFDSRRVNRVNERKEFFRVTIDEIAAAVRDSHGEIELTLAAEAAEYRQTLALLAREQNPAVAPSGNLLHAGASVGALAIS